jgi:hypothetical protein
VVRPGSAQRREPAGRPAHRAVARSGCDQDASRPTSLRSRRPPACASPAGRASQSRVAFGYSSRSRSVPALPRADHLVRHHLGWPRKQGAKRPERRHCAPDQRGVAAMGCDAAALWASAHR